MTHQEFEEVLREHVAAISRNALEELYVRDFMWRVRGFSPEQLDHLLHSAKDALARRYEKEGKA